jgi:ferredoxin-NADP reductase
MKQYKAIVADIRELSPSVKLFELDLGGHILAFQPGQWVDVQLNTDFPDSNAPFSIASIPDGGAIEIAVKHTEHIPLSTFFHEQLNIGDPVIVSEAQGNIILPPNQREPVVFIAGGTGITPFISVLRHMYAAHSGVRATLLYSAASAEECLFYDDLTALQEANPFFRFFLTTTREAAHHAEFYGRIGSEMLRRAGIDHQAHYYLCGPPQMVDDINDLLLDLGIPQGQLHFDKWW